MEEKTHKILNLISEKPEVSQRTLASESGFSVGLVNLILKRLIETGHIKISNLNKKRAQYLLTPKGIVEKTKQGYNYISKTVNVFMEYRKRLTQLVERLDKKGHRRLAILGRGEIANLLELTIRTGSVPITFRYVKEGEKILEDELLMDCRFEDNHESSVGVVILSELLNKPFQTDGNGIKAEEISSAPQNGIKVKEKV